MDSFVSRQALILMFVVYMKVWTSISQHFKHFETQSNTKIIEEFTYCKVISTNAIRCAAHCAEKTGCNSASFSSNLGLCVLSTYEVYNPGEESKLSMESTWTTIWRKGCWKGWTKVGDICYYFDQDQKFFNQSMKYCRDIGGKLTEPQTNTTFEVLRTYTRKNLMQLNSSYWIGLEDLNEDDAFVWTSNGALPTYSDWKRDTLTARDGYRCVYLNRAHVYKWDICPCTDRKGTVCEM